MNFHNSIFFLKEPFLNWNPNNRSPISEKLVEITSYKGITGLFAHWMQPRCILFSIISVMARAIEKAGYDNNGISCDIT